MTNSQKIVDLITEAAASKKALDITVLDVRKKSNLLDYLLVLSGEAVSQLRAIEKEIDKTLRKHRIKSLHWQGVAQSGWIVLDLGSIVVHVMGTAEREYYNLEDLWGKEAIVYHY